MTKQIRIGVGAITRQRPAMFGELLDSFAKMSLPEGADVIFLFAENDERLSMEAQVAAFAERTGHRALIELEPRPGIPMARNKVLDMALREGCDLLTFVDDDELVRPDWLESLVTGAQARDLDLAGGPIHYTAPSGHMSYWNRACFDFLLDRGKKRNHIRAKAVEKGTDEIFPVYTNNWCARLSTVRELGLRFDERLQFTGGSDTRFSLDLAAAGGKVGWVPDAIVEEPTPQKRLLPGYQFTRARDQAANSVRLRSLPLRRILPYAVSRYFDAILVAISALFLGKHHLIRAIYKVGMGTGRIKGYFGRESQHYAPGTEKVHTEED
ncbi:hypothetical protein SAMN05421688_0684 [Poseidonocella pacifica]|uniref:Glycosyltransferase 2-like domain-containing protein n=1 Tax=Poseidonocella pacifica TaxID=871651 RepID=A0A1I0VIZ0_9RHOB|nr:glycosyltransferase family 2 protein [Poseidonocella pacifica]SFA76291.1 hypothetical protein SAMN05421688_0684 [Poseidonocella pacifica]